MNIFLPDMYKMDGIHIFFHMDHIFMGISGLCKIFELSYVPQNNISE